MKISMLAQEYWYLPVSAYGSQLPLHASSEGEFSLRRNPTMNQMVSALFSSKGRYLYAPEGFDLKVSAGTLELSEEVELVEAGSCLREAYEAFIKKYDVRPNETLHLPDEFTQKNVYNTWIEMTFFQNQKDILAYARALIADGFEPGVLMIDDGWSDYYGKWKFSVEKFPDPKSMIQELKNLGFKVMLWIVPFVTTDSLEARMLLMQDLVLKNGEAPHTPLWWNGVSAVLDLRKPEARGFLQQQMAELMEMGIDGFKFDAGDSIYYLEEHEPDLQSYLWAELASQYPYNELRSDFNTQGLSIMERLSDQKHAWGEGGLRTSSLQLWHWVWEAIPSLHRT